MKVQVRDTSIKYPPAIRHHKQELLFSWLKEFGFSSHELLARRLGLSSHACDRLFKKLRDEKWLLRFHNAHTGAMVKYLMLGPEAILWADCHGIDRIGAKVRPKSLERHSHVLHDLYVQQAVLVEIEALGATEVVVEGNIEVGERINRPDALITSEKGKLIALEVERWQKAEARIFSSFYNHATRIIEKSHQGTIYYFTKTSDLDAYKRRFDLKEWPIYRRIKGKLLDSKEFFKPDEVEHLRQCFRFKVLED